MIILSGIAVCYEYMEDGFMYYLLEVKCINCGLRRRQIKLLINKQNKAVIFDMDGVIFDSEQAVYNGWKELSQKYGFENLDIPYMKCIGVNGASSRRIFLDYYGEDFPYDKYKDEQSKNYHEKYDGGRLPLKKGVRELLQNLKTNNYKVAIASSTRTALVVRQIEEADLAQYFDVIVGGDMVSRSKPEPDIFLRACDELGCEPGEAYVIEDSYNGIRAAFAAGMHPVMVPDMLAPDDEMAQKAEAVLDDLTAVWEYISGCDNTINRNATNL